MADQWETRIVCSTVSTYSVSEGVRLELVDEIRGKYKVAFFGNDSLMLGLSLITAYFVHCVLWWRDRIIPLNNR